MVAVLVTAFGLATRAVNTRVWATDGSTVPTVQRPDVPLYVPWLGEADTNVRPAGNRSWTDTFVAGSGPRSASPTVNVIVSPTLGVGSLTDLVSDRSARSGVSVALAVLLPGSGSN